MDTELPENDDLDAGRPRACTTATPTRAWRSTRCSASAASRVLGRSGIEPGVVHLNEGHAAFAALAMARAAELPERDVRRGARRAPRAHDLHHAHAGPGGQRHVPVRPGRGHARALAERAGIDVHAIVRRGRTHPDDGHEPFGVTQFALRTQPRRQRRRQPPRRGRARDVARAVARPRDRRRPDHPRHQRRARPVVGRRADARGCSTATSARTGGARGDDPRRWDGSTTSDEELWAVRREQRALLVEFVRERASLDRLARGEPRHYVEAAAQAFDPDVLTIGFARRVATYKRLNLLFRDPDRAIGILGGDRPVQLLISGKAHPKDDEGKSSCRTCSALKDRPGAASASCSSRTTTSAPRAPRARLRRLGQRPAAAARGQRHVRHEVGAQRRPAALRARRLVGRGLRRRPTAGRCPATSTTTTATRTTRDAAELYRLLEEEVVPAFYDRGDDGIPHAWLERVKTSMKTNGPRFPPTGCCATTRSTSTAAWP